MTVDRRLFFLFCAAGTGQVIYGTLAFVLQKPYTWQTYAYQGFWSFDQVACTGIPGNVPEAFRPGKPFLILVGAARGSGEVEPLIPAALTGISVFATKKLHASSP